MIAESRSKRGSAMLGFLPLVVLLGTMCAIVTSRSLDMYRASGAMEVRLQARAAAEGAAAAGLANAPGTPADFDAGRCRVTFGTATGTADERTLPFTVEVLGNEQTLIAAFEYTAWLRPGSNGTWQFDRLERTP